MNEKENKEDLYDDRGTLYTYVQFDTFDDPYQAQKEVLFALEGRMDWDALFTAALPVLYRLKMHIPRVPIIADHLVMADLEEWDATTLVRVIVETGSYDNYRDQIAIACKKYHSLLQFLPR